MPGLILEDCNGLRRCATSATMTIEFEDVTGATLTHKHTTPLAWTTDSEYTAREAADAMLQSPFFAFDFVDAGLREADTSFEAAWTEPEPDTLEIHPPDVKESWDCRSFWREEFLRVAIAREVDARSFDPLFQAAMVAAGLYEAFQKVDVIPSDNSQEAAEAKLAEIVAAGDEDFLELHAPHIVRTR